MIVLYFSVSIDILIVIFIVNGLGLVLIVVFIVVDVYVCGIKKGILEVFIVNLIFDNLIIWLLKRLYGE